MASTSTSDSSLAMSISPVITPSICQICLNSEKITNLSNIKEVGPDKENWAKQINHYFGIQVCTIESDIYICWNCLKQVIDWARIRKDCLIKQMVNKYFRNETEQGKNLPQNALSEFCSELTLQLTHPASEVLTEGSLEPIAESCMERISGSSLSPIPSPSLSPIPGPSWGSIAGPSWAPVAAGPSIEPIAGPSWARVPGPSWAPVPGPSIEPTAGPSWAQVPGPSWAPVLDASIEPIAGPSWAPVVEPSSISSSSITYTHKNTSDVVIPMKNKLQNVKNTCPFCHFHSVNSQTFQFDSNVKLCNRHNKPYTCLLKDCYLVFPCIDVFISHYRSHLKLNKQTYLCRKCLAILNCSRNVKRDNHKHQDTSKLFNCCSEQFPDMTHFVLHKLEKHPTTVTIVMSINQMKHYPKGRIYPLKSLLCATKMDVCQKSSGKLFTCIVPRCDRVYDLKFNNTEHFKDHAEIPAFYSVCGTCLVYSFTDGFRLNCNHINPLIICRICNTSFSKLFDLAKHKVIFHKSTVLCGPDSVPGCFKCRIIFKSDEDPTEHYMQCFNNKKSNLAENFINTPQNTNSVLKPMIINSTLDGSYICKVCDNDFIKLDHYVEHVKKHNQSYYEKDKNILMCPLCDKNYAKLDYFWHIENCTKSMLLSEDYYGCVYCLTKVKALEPYKFRYHFIYCKSFEVLKDDNDQDYYKCINCTFQHYNLLIAYNHANANCIYFQLKMNYAMGIDERQKVEEKNLAISENSKIDLKPIISMSSHFNPTVCDRSRKKLLQTYDYLCHFCGKGFYSEFIFKRHLNVDRIECRPPYFEYCEFCICDFNSINEFSLHLNDTIIEPSVQPEIECGVVNVEPYVIPFDDQNYENMSSHSATTNDVPTPGPSNVASNFPSLRSDLDMEEDDDDDSTILSLESDDVIITDEYLVIEDEKPN